MSLSKKLKNPTPSMVVQVSDSEGFPVRGLNPTDVFGIYYRHTGQLAALFEKLIEGFQQNGAFDTADIQTVALDLIKDAPMVMAEIIAAAADGNPDDSESWEADVGIARRFTFPVQADALAKIGELTFTSEMPPGKFLSLVVGLVARATGQIPIPST